MFFNTIKEARLHCALEISRTHRLHKVVECNKYRCSVEGEVNLLPGYTIQLVKGEKR